MIKIGDIIISKGFFLVAGTGNTAYIYYKQKYLIHDINYINGIKYFIFNCKWKSKYGSMMSPISFSENDLLEKFDCYRCQRKEKLEKLNFNEKQMS